ncbi:MAG TPA: methyltransferase domain-containing protein [Pseudolabrys sp.]|nr:methyltransferase domain-containing protein [Pseudolabrys sp.]
MNRKQRRAALKQGPSADGNRTSHAGVSAARLFVEAESLQRQNKLEESARVYKRLLLLKPDHAQANNNLGAVLHAQGKLREASIYFAHSLSLMPQLLEQIGGVNATLLAVLPAFGEAMRRAAMAWPIRLPIEQLLGSTGLPAIYDDPMLLCLMQSVPPRNINFERVMTSLRLSLLDSVSAGETFSPSALAFSCALATQCFINEYIFATTADEDGKAERLKAALIDDLKSGAMIAPLSVATVAMYQPLYSLPDAQALLDRTWPPAVDEIVTQQLREPLQELQLRASITQLTPIDDEISQRVRQQYEENPYPRWVKAAAGIKPTALDVRLRGMFPTATFTPLGKTEAVDILVAGCGTSLGAPIAQDYQGARVLAVDLSLSSLCYAKRTTPVSLADRIEYAQGDILKLGAIGRTFDMIDCQGVLHHMRDPFEGWRILLSLLRPGGIMHLGFYSEIARHDVAGARAYIAQHGYVPTPADIRRVRHDLLKTPMASVSRFNDFFSMSECRDLLFHVQEKRLTIPAIKAFIDEQGLQFIGFDLKDNAAKAFRAMFADAGWSMSDLAKWDIVERKYPDTFMSMYIFWVQKR